MSCWRTRPACTLRPATRQPPGPARLHLSRETAARSCGQRVATSAPLAASGEPDRARRCRRRARLRVCEGRDLGPSERPRLELALAQVRTSYEHCVRSDTRGASAAWSVNYKIPMGRRQVRRVLSYPPFSARTCHRGHLRERRSAAPVSVARTRLACPCYLPLLLAPTGSVRQRPCQCASPRVTSMSVR